MRLPDIRELILRHAGASTPIARGALISRVDRSGLPELSMSGTVFVLLAQGEKQLVVGDRVHEYSAGHGLVTTVDLPVTGRFVGATPEHPALGFALPLRPALIAELLLESGNALDAGRRRASQVGVAIGEAGDDLVDAVGRMIRLIERPADRTVLAPLVERELHWLLLRSPLGAATRELGVADSNAVRVGEALRWIRDHHAEPFRVEELAALTRMSPSAFHRAFKAITSLSPIQYQKQVRLQEARARLLTDPGDVAGAARAVGYASASQFSREYRQRFGVSPTQDVARAAGIAGNGR